MIEGPTASRGFWCARKLPRMALPALMLFLAGWGLWAILLDRQPTFSDSVLGDSDELYRALRLGEPTLRDWLEHTGYRPFLTYLPASLCYLLTGPSLAVLRVIMLLQHLGAVFVAFSIGRRLAGRRAGLLAAVMLGTFPLVFGWGRMAYVDTGLGLMVLVGLRVLLDGDLSRTRTRVGLGLAVGLGALTKVAYPIFAIGPLLWTVGLKLRSLRQLVGLGLAAVVALAVAGWWYAANWSMVLANLNMSTGTQRVGGVGASLPHRLLAALPELQVKLACYTTAIDGGVWMLALAAVGTVAAWRLRTVRGQALLLLTLTLWLSFAVVLLFDEARRYVLPVYMVAAVLAGLTTQSVVDRIGGRRMGQLTLGVLATCLLGLFVAFNLGLPVYTPPGGAFLVAGPRVDGVGLLTPDRRPLTTYPAVIRAVQARHTSCLMVFAGPELQERQLFRDLCWRIQGGSPSPLMDDLRGYRAEHPAGKPVCVVEVTGDHQPGWHEPQFEAGTYTLCVSHGWFDGLRPRARALGRWGPSPIGLRYALFELPPDALDRVVPPSQCRLRQVGWDRSR